MLGCSPAFDAYVASMRSCRSLLIFIPLTIVACVSEPYPFLWGQWGGAGVALDARETEVKLEFNCGLKAIAPELGVDAAGHFEGTAQIIGGIYRGTGTSLPISGDVLGARMVIAVTYVYPGYAPPSPQLYSLRLGAPSDLGCTLK